MKYQVKLNSIEDADEYFLVAKDRLLDVNEWDDILANNSYNFILTDAHGQKLHRDAHSGDMIKTTVALERNTSKDRWMQIERIQYDSYPDINAEEISLHLKLSFSPSGNGIDLALYSEKQQRYTIIINRTQSLVSINDTMAKDEPVFDIPKSYINQLLKGILTISEYAE